MKQVRDVKIGEYVRFTEKGPVWIRQEFDRTSGKYVLAKASDMNHTTLRRGSYHVHTGFTY